jgi:uncharacterized coiled-coil DUF342 family protein
MSDEKIITHQDVLLDAHDEIAKLEWQRDGLMASVDSFHHEKIVLQKRIAELEVMLRRIQEHGVEYDSDIRAIDAVLNKTEVE